LINNDNYFNIGFHANLTTISNFVNIRKDRILYPVIVYNK